MFDDANPISDVLASTLRRTGESGPGVGVIERARDNALYAQTHINNLKVVDDHLKSMAFIAEPVSGYSIPQKIRKFKKKPKKDGDKNLRFDACDEITQAVLLESRRSELAK